MLYLIALKNKNKNQKTFVGKGKHISLTFFYCGFDHLFYVFIFIWIADVGTDRYTFGFTLRDSPDFFINVSVWGSEGYVAALSGSISVGDCGKELS